MMLLPPHLDSILLSFDTMHIFSYKLAMPVVEQLVHFTDPLHQPWLSAASLSLPGGRLLGNLIET